ncbi:hypothetical protein [Acetobacter sp.]|jgi:hypothetical protein|uniref:hypothetical protein n=1 Tax=Acetobacter sp. TaxID=440 RepID=UPI0025B8CFF9|nr:hypothetical protein [Acetobacter sp.]MCI1301283.1 hypothetical protein [Acetobacter sp.]
MFTPELVTADSYILVHNHSLETPRAVEFALKFTVARVSFGRANLPTSDMKIKLYFDVRGQTLCPEAEMRLTAIALGVDSVMFKRS